MRSRIVSLALFVVFVAAPLSAQAASEAVQIHLNKDYARQYVVPAGKVLLIEYINFNESWVDSGDPLEVSLQTSLNPSGPVWNTRLRYYSSANALPRVLRVPAGRGLFLPDTGSALYKAFIYGVLVDASSQAITP